MHAVGIKSRIDENSWIGTNIGVLQNEIALKKAALEEIPYTMEWCEKAGVKQKKQNLLTFFCLCIILSTPHKIDEVYIIKCCDKSSPNSFGPLLLES